MNTVRIMLPDMFVRYPHKGAALVVDLPADHHLVLIEDLGEHIDCS